MKKTLSLLLATLFVLLAFSGCSSFNGKESFGIYLESGLTSIDPALCNSTNDATIIAQAFRGLYTINKSNALKPDLAHKYSVSEDGLTYTFNLKQGIAWSDSKDDVTAEDVVFSWKRAAAITLKNKSIYADLFSNIAGYSEALEGYKNGSEFNLDKLQIKVIDAKDKKGRPSTSYELSVTLAEKDSAFLEKLTNPVFFPVNKEMVEKNGDAWASNPETCLSNGVYKLREIKAKENIDFLGIESSYIALVNNTDHEGHNVDRSQVTIYFLTNADKATVIEKYKEDITNEKDKNALIYVGGLSKKDVADWDAFLETKATDIEALDEKKDKNEISIQKDILKLYEKSAKSSTSTSEYFLSFNTKVEPLNNPLVRKALTLAIDRNYICNIALNTSNEEPAEAIISGGFMDSSSTKTIRAFAGNYFNAGRYETYLNKAKECLAKAGYPNGEGFPDIRYLYNGDDKVAATVAEAVRKAWTDLGVTSVFIESATGSSYTAALQSNIYGVIGTSYNFFTPVSVLDMFTTDSELNYSNWSNEEYDELVDEIYEYLDVALTNHSGFAPEEISGENADEEHKEIGNKIAQAKSKISPILRDAEDILFEDDAWIVAPIYSNVNHFLCNSRLSSTYTSNYGITYFGFIEFKDN